MTITTQLLSTRDSESQQPLDFTFLAIMRTVLRTPNFPLALQLLDQNSEILAKGLDFHLVRTSLKGLLEQLNYSFVQLLTRKSKTKRRYFPVLVLTIYRTPQLFSSQLMEIYWRGSSFRVPVLALETLDL